MIRAVFDSNVLVSYLVAHRRPLATLIDHHLVAFRFELVTALALLEELDRVLRYPKLQRYYSDAERNRFVALILALSEVVELPGAIPRICRDRDDDRVIACAVAGAAGVIVSGDRDLLSLKRAGDIRILTAAEFLEVLARAG